MNLETRQAYSEVNTFLELIGKELADEIPIKLREFFKREMDKTYKFVIDLDKPIIEQKLKRKTIAIIAGLNINYWCKDEERKKELLQIYFNNERTYQERLREKYNSDNIFKGNQREIIGQNTNLPIKIEKESLIHRFINFIKNLITKKAN